MHRSLRVIGSGAIEALVRAGRNASARATPTPGSLQLGDALGREIDAIRAQIEPILARELPST